jgi:tetratricopeptide (TPR) repeat protein
MANVSPPHKPRGDSRGTLVYVSVCLLALAARGFYVWQIRQAPIFALLLGDASSYDAWARQIADGDWIGKGVFYQAPLYPYFLGLVYALVGRNLLVVRLIQIVIGAGSCGLLAQAGQRFFSRTVGALAGVILALHPTAIFFDCSIEKSVLDLFFVCALLAILGGLLEGPRWQWWAAAGIALGLIGLTRENALAFFPVILAWLFVQWRGERWTVRLRWAGMFVAGAAVVLLPVAVRNLMVGGEFYLTTAQFGPNFYVGNGKDATGFYKPLRWGRGNAQFERADATALAEQASGRNLTPSGVSHYWTMRAIDEIRGDFDRWLRLMGKKWLLVWNISEVGDSEDQYTYGDRSSMLRVLNHVLHFGTLCPLAVLGICLTWRCRERLWLLYVMALSYTMSVVLFYVFSRYRFPLVPIVVLFAAAGLAFWRDSVRKARWRAIGSGVGAAIVAVALCNGPMVSEAHIRAWTHYNIAASLAEQDPDSELALAHCLEALRLQPEFPQARVQLGAMLAHRGRTKDAMDQYQQALQSHPDYSEAHNDLGVALASEGKAEEAAMQFAEALRLDPDNAQAHYNLGNSLLDIGKVNYAITEYEQAVRIQPDFASAQNSLARALVRVGKTQDAIAGYQRSLLTSPNHANAHYQFGNFLLQVGRVNDAVAEYEEAVRFQPDFAKAQNNLGVALARLGRIPDAIGHYQQVLRINPDDAEAHYNLGNAFQQLGNVSEAIGHYQETVRIDPQYADAHNNLGNLLLQQGRLNDALVEYERAARTRPDSAAAESNLGLALARLGKVQDAIAHYQQALRIDPNRAEAHYNLGNALEQSGDVPNAITHYQEALRIDPNDADAQKHLARLRATRPPSTPGASPPNQ